MLVAFGIPAIDRIVSKNGNEFYSYDASHPELVAARLSALSSLDHFQQMLETSEQAKEFAVSVRVFTERGGYESVWLENVRFPDRGTVAGTISHDTLNRLKGGLSKGSYVVSSRQDVDDWSYRDGGRLRGNFSLRALMDLEEEAVQNSILADLHKDPVPDDN